MSSFQERQFRRRREDKDDVVFVLENIPEGYDESLITDFVEGTLDVDVKEVQMYAYVPGRALVFLQQNYDLARAKKEIEAAELESNKILLRKTSRRCALVVLNNDFQKLSEEFLCLYFESEFADGASVLEMSRAFPELNMAVVYFKSCLKSVVEKITTIGDLMALPSENYSITVVPFYEHFHENITSNRHHRKPETILTNKSRTAESILVPGIEDRKAVKNTPVGGKNNDRQAAQNTPVRGNNENRKAPQNTSTGGSFLDRRDSGEKKETKNIRYETSDSDYEKEEDENCEDCKDDTDDTYENISDNETENNDKNVDVGDDNEMTEHRREDTLTSLFHRQQNSATERRHPEMNSKISRRGRGHFMHYKPQSSSSSLSSPSSLSSSSSGRGRTFKYNGRENQLFVRSEFEVDLQQAALNDKSATQNEELIQVQRTETELGDAKITESKSLKIKEQRKDHKETIPMTSWQAALLQYCFKDYEDCFVYYDSQSNCAVIKGIKDKVDECSLDLLKELKTIHTEHLALTSSMHSVLSREQGKRYLEEFNSNHKGQLTLFLEGGSLIVASVEEDALRSNKDFLKERFNYSDVLKSDSPVPNDKLVSLQSQLERDHMIKMTWNDGRTEILIEGFRDDVCKTLNDINDVVEEYGVLEKQFIANGFHAKYLYKNFNSDVKPVLTNVEITDMVFTETQISLKCKGEKKEVNKVYRKLNELTHKVIEMKWDLISEFGRAEDIMLVIEGFNSDTLKRKIKDLEQNRKCIISVDLPDIKYYSLKVRERPTTQTKHVPGDDSSVMAPEVSELHVQMTPKCRLIVKSRGDITQEDSQVLVCVVGSKLDLRNTATGKAFNNLCPDLWLKLKAEHQAHPTDTILTTKGPFPNLHPQCKAICHTILAPWDPDKTPADLSTMVQTVIGQAVTLGATSVSFPVMGCGRAFKFPAAKVAEIMISSLKSCNVVSGMEKIVFLAPDDALFKEFKIVAPQDFRVLLSKQKPRENSGAGNETDVDDNENEDVGSKEESEEEEMVIETKNVPRKFFKTEISIVAKCDDPVKLIWSDLKRKIQKVCLHEACFNSDLANSWPRETRSRILQEAKKNHVWVKSFLNPKSKKPGYIIRGMKSNVDIVLNIIQKEYKKFTRHLPKKRIVSNQTPKRGTLDFLRYAAESDERFPSYWKLNNSKTEWGDTFNSVDKNSPNERNVLVNVDKKVTDAIQTLINKTWDASLVGAGSDAVGLNHTSIKVVKVERIENFRLFDAYSTHRKQLIYRQAQDKQLCSNVAKLQNSKGQVVTTEHLEDFMKEELIWEVNEHYLFHGTKCPEAITANGLDPKVSSGMFGKGIYTAEKFTKSDQYTDSRHDRSPPGTNLTIILARILLGNVSLCDENHKSLSSKGAPKLNRPPCMHCNEDVCNCSNQALYDSVMADGKWLFREFIVYEKSQCYPEYLITYQRV